MRPRLRRGLAEWAQSVHQLSQRRVAGLIPVERGTLRYQHHRDRQEALRVRLRELAGSRVRYGYRRLTVLLKREGWDVNAKRMANTRSPILNRGAVSVPLVQCRCEVGIRSRRLAGGRR